MSSNITRTRENSDASSSACRRLTTVAVNTAASSCDSPRRPAASPCSAWRTPRRSARYGAQSAHQHRGPLVERQIVERALQTRPQLFLREQAVWGQLGAGRELPVRSDVLIERHLIGPVPASPESVPVTRLVDRNAIDPGAQARL